MLCSRQLEPASKQRHRAMTQWAFLLPTYEVSEDCWPTCSVWSPDLPTEHFCARPSSLLRILHSRACISAAQTEYCVHLGAKQCLPWRESHARIYQDPSSHFLEINYCAWRKESLGTRLILSIFISKPKYCFSCQKCWDGIVNDILSYLHLHKSCINTSS